MMKVSNLWRMGFIFVAGILIGVIGTMKYIGKKQDNTPAGQEITIGKLKIKGNNNTDIIDIEATNEQTELSRRDKRRARRNK